MFGGRAYPVVLSTTDAKTFSNTMAWNKDRLQSLKRVDMQLVEQITCRLLSNDSPVTLAEVEGLLEMQRTRTAAREAAIRHEITFDGTMDRFTALTREDRRRLRNAMYTTVEPVIMHLKKRFDRVRPRALDRRIRPSIDPPGHPAYPSGHATQAYYIALSWGRSSLTRAKGSCVPPTPWRGTGSGQGPLPVRHGRRQRLAEQLIDKS